MPETLENSSGRERKVGLKTRVLRLLGWRAASENIPKSNGASRLIQAETKRTEDILRRRKPLEERRADLKKLWKIIDEILEDEPYSAEGLTQKSPESELDAILIKVRRDEIDHEKRAFSGKVITPFGEADYTIVDDAITISRGFYNDPKKGEVRFSCDQFSRFTDIAMPSQIYDPKKAALKHFSELLEDYSKLKNPNAQSGSELAA